MTKSPFEVCKECTERKREIDNKYTKLQTIKDPVEHKKKETEYYNLVDTYREKC